MGEETSEYVQVPRTIEWDMDGRVAAASKLQEVLTRNGFPGVTMLICEEALYQAVEAYRDLPGDSPLAGEKWCLGSTRGRKVIHRRSCSGARLDYGWARQYPTVEALATALVVEGGAAWHHACNRCCKDLNEAIQAALSGSNQHPQGDQP